MTVEYATLGLAHTTRAGGVPGGGVCQVRREYTDFTVDGGPLLLRLADLDGFPPAASDLVPAALAPAARRRPLPGADGPAGSGRYPLYVCPDCPGRACGEVTAVVERDAQGDVIRVLLVGPRVASFARLAAALRTTGIGADLTRDATGTAPEELCGYGAVLFDPAVRAPERAACRAAFTAAGAGAALVDRPAPLLPVLVAQLEQLVHRPAAGRRLTGLRADGGGVRVEVGTACRVRVTGYRRDRLRRLRTAELYAGRLDRGTHLLDGFGGPGAYVVARTFEDVVVADAGGAAGPPRPHR
ncbi:oxidoreductase [Streptomyces sp. URMC 126]|uniref:oxidoreductase n=1 Tax=Streptomyces sp. URMC 126 TaxID=3423401 RepID=UPI003F1CA02A